MVVPDEYQYAGSASCREEGTGCLVGHFNETAVDIRTPYSSDCATRLLLDRIADKWAVLVLGMLMDAPKRFNDLRRAIEGISQKMLSQTLRSLERDGLVSRRAFATVPVTVEYSITPLGKSLAAPMDALRIWAESHMDQVLANQLEFDAGATSRI